ncbi:MAG TPA: M67 family metallopeptidase [Novosphingobium sp.]|nr:M67 family metallopeptidase [Novosphingobium sp.]
MRMTLVVARGVIEALLAEAARRDPEECCGLLLGEGDIDAITSTANVAAEPHRRFEIDPAALIAAHKASRAGGAQIAGYYHSHPAGIAEPSATDRALAARDGRVWAIVAGRSVTFWRDAPGGFEPLSYTVADG